MARRQEGTPCLLQEDRRGGLYVTESIAENLNRQQRVRMERGLEDIHPVIVVRQVQPPVVYVEPQDCEEEYDEVDSQSEE